MKIFINQTEVEIDGTPTLAELLAQLNLATGGIAVALNNRVVPRASWADVRPTDGAKLTIITAVCGG